MATQRGPAPTDSHPSKYGNGNFLDTSPMNTNANRVPQYNYEFQNQDGQNIQFSNQGGINTELPNQHGRNAQFPDQDGQNIWFPDINTKLPGGNTQFPNQVDQNIQFPNQDGQNTPNQGGQFPNQGGRNTQFPNRDDQNIQFPNQSGQFPNQGGRNTQFPNQDDQVPNRYGQNTSNHGGHFAKMPNRGAHREARAINNTTQPQILPPNTGGRYAAGIPPANVHPGAGRMYNSGPRGMCIITCSPHLVYKYVAIISKGLR